MPPSAHQSGGVHSFAGSHRHPTAALPAASSVLTVSTVSTSSPSAPAPVSRSGALGVASPPFKDSRFARAPPLPASPSPPGLASRPCLRSRSRVCRSLDLQGFAPRIDRARRRLVSRALGAVSFMGSSCWDRARGHRPPRGMCDGPCRGPVTYSELEKSGAGGSEDRRRADKKETSRAPQAPQRSGRLRSGAIEDHQRDRGATAQKEMTTYAGGRRQELRGRRGSRGLRAVRLELWPSTGLLELAGRESGGLVRPRPVERLQTLPSTLWDH